MGSEMCIRDSLVSPAALANRRMKKVSMWGRLAFDGGPQVRKMFDIEVISPETMATTIISCFGSCMRCKNWSCVFPPMWQAQSQLLRSSFPL